jgi:hypothetical protein
MHVGRGYVLSQTFVLRWVKLGKEGPEGESDETDKGISAIYVVCQTDASFSLKYLFLGTKYSKVEALSSTPTNFRLYLRSPR